MFDFWSVYSSERFRASWPSCLMPHLKNIRGFNYCVLISGHPRAQKYTLIQAKAIAMTAVDIMLNPELLTKIKESFKADLQSGV